MSKISRRRFLGSSAALPLGVGAASSAAAQDRPSTGSASLIIDGGRVLTMDPHNPVVEAVAVLGDRILAVGTSEDMLSLASTGTDERPALVCTYRSRAHHVE